VKNKLVAIICAAGLACVAQVGTAAGEAHWSYAGATGPAKWGTLSKEFALCKKGERQSPIDIPDAEVRKGDLPPLLFNYKPSPLRIIDDGHTIRVDYAPGSFLTVSGNRYQLVSFDFHKPSQYKVSGKEHEMEVDLTHEGKDGKLAIVAVFLDPGQSNPLVKTLWSNLPRVKDKEHVVPSVTINAYGLLPESKDHYTLAGSLTTPPCTENVTWYVLKTPVQLSADQIARFARLYPMNARPVERINERDLVGSR
jgi:carbonic anhydrase